MQPLLLLHGAVGSSAQMSQIASVLGTAYDLQLFDFPGHGGKDTDADFSIPSFSQSVISFLDEQNIDSIPVFGYSMGGYVAMYLARHYPTRIKRVMTLATKFEWTEEIAGKEVRMLQPGVIEQKVPAFAAELERRHQPQDWKLVMEKTAAMLTVLGKDNTLKKMDYNAIDTPCLLMIGDRDKMVTLEETVTVYKHLPNAFLAVLPGTPHPIEQVNTGLLATHIGQFMSG